MVKIKDLRLGDLFIYMDDRGFCHVCKYLRTVRKHNAILVGPFTDLLKPFLITYDTGVFSSLEDLRRYNEEK